MHVEPDLVDRSKISLSYATATVALAYTRKLAFQALKNESQTALLLSSAVAIALVFCFFELLPHHLVDVICSKGVRAKNMSDVASFGAAYMSVVLVEPLIYLGILAIAKSLHRFRNSTVVDKRLYSPV